MMDCLLGHCRPTEVIPLLAMMIIIVIALWWTAQFVACVWAWYRLRLSAELVNKRKISVMGVTYFDPTYGIMASVSDPETGKMIEVIINPEFWKFLPGSPTLNQGNQKESAILGTSYSAVHPGTEPASLVAIKSRDRVVGFGCRIVFNGRTYLLTAHHVWNHHMPITALAKHGLEVAVMGI